MIIEAYELWNMIFHGKVGGLALFFLSVVSYLLFIKYKAIGFSDVVVNHDRPAVSAVVPFYKEEAALLKSCLMSVRAAGATEIICVSDNPNEPNLEMVNSLVDKLLIIPQRMGKRVCLSAGFAASKFNKILFVDSDTILQPDTLDNMIEVMGDGVGGVSCRHDIHESDLHTFQGIYSQIIEDSRLVVDCALSRAEKMVVLDGRCVLYERSAIADYILSEDFTNEQVGKYVFVTGDDRQLTRHLLRTWMED